MHLRPRPARRSLLLLCALSASLLGEPVVSHADGPAVVMVESYASVGAERYNAAHQPIEREFDSRTNFTSYSGSESTVGSLATLNASVSGSIGGAISGFSGSGNSRATVVEGGTTIAGGSFFVKVNITRPVYVSIQATFSETGDGRVTYPYANESTECVLLIGSQTFWVGSRSVGGTYSGGFGSASFSVSVAFHESPGGIDDGCAAAFDWSMADRYVVDPDTNLPKPFAPDGALDVTPAGFDVRFDSPNCGSRTARWRLDGSVIGSGCQFTHRFPQEGSYSVTLELLESGDVVAEMTQTVEVSDILIVSLGDSVASGEGVPDRAAPNAAVGPVWQNRQCHRSPRAGPAQAALALERRDPKTSVTFVHLACSGATVASGIIGPYAGQEPDPQSTPLPPQIDQMRELVEDRPIDAVLISVGANDVRFKEIVLDCLWQSACHDRTDPASAANQFDALVSLLPTWYDLVAGALTGVEPGRVYLTEYFDPTRDQTGAFCDDKILEEVVNAPFIGISGDEARWAGTDMLPTLNAVGDAAAAAHGWRRVGGIFSEFETHGYCSDSPWIRRLGESLERQQRVDGALHPNEDGHLIYGARIVAAVESAV